jgi:hypothetical protein
MTVKVTLHLYNALSIQMDRTEDGLATVVLDFRDDPGRVRVGHVETEWTKRPLYVERDGELYTRQDDSP